MKNAIEATVNKWGALHVSLSSAGVVWQTIFLSSKKNLDIKTFKSVIDVNLYGSLYVAKYSSIYMAKNK